MVLYVGWWVNRIYLLVQFSRHTYAYHILSIYYIQYTYNIGAFQNQTQTQPNIMKAHRDKLQQQRRRQHINLILAKQRIAIQHAHQQQDRAKFMQVYPELDYESYPKHKYFIALLASDPAYTPQLVMLAGILHDYLGEWPEDVDSLHILKHISQYEHIEVPQTQQFVDWLNSRFLASNNNKIRIDLLLIVSNLLSYPQYQSMLRDRLIEAGFVTNAVRFGERVVNEKLCGDREEEEIIAFIADILCLVLGSHPRLPLSTIAPFIHDLHKLAQTSSSARQSLLFYFTQLRSTHKPNSSLAKLLLTQLKQFIIKQYHGAELHIIHLLLYAAHSGVYVRERKIVGIVVGCVVRGMNGIVEGALQCLELYLRKSMEEEEDLSDLVQSEEQQNEIGHALWNMLADYNKNRANPDILTHIISVLTMLNDSTLYGTFYDLNHNTQDALIVLIECLEKQQMRSKTAELVFRLIELDGQLGENSEGGSALKINFEALGGLRMLQQIANEQTTNNNQYDNSVREPIEQLMDMFQSSMQ